MSKIAIWLIKKYVSNNIIGPIKNNMNSSFEKLQIMSFLM